MSFPTSNRYEGNGLQVAKSFSMTDHCDAKMNYYFLDTVDWRQSQGFYHAAAYLQHEALFILRPATPYVCIGFHQDAEQEIDLDFTRNNGIPVYRREVGGGAVYLDSNQLFYQLILHKNRPEVPKDKTELFRKFLYPVVETYQEFGVQAEYKPINDILANGRKVSGNGAAEINEMVVLVGNFILDFNYEMMSKCLCVPDEKFRDKVYKTLQENLTTFKRETGHVPKPRSLSDALAHRYEAILGPMKESTCPGPQLMVKAQQLHTERHSSDWLYANDRRRSGGRQIKIRDGIYVIYNILKTTGGLIRVTAMNQDGRLQDVHISGDFFIYPADSLARLECAINDAPADINSITETISQFYINKSIETPGIIPQDFARALCPENG
jgi:lipoate-protein ligase A